MSTRHCLSPRCSAAGTCGRPEVYTLAWRASVRWPDLSAGRWLASSSSDAEHYYVEDVGHRAEETDDQAQVAMDLQQSHNILWHKEEGSWPLCRRAASPVSRSHEPTIILKSRVILVGYVSKNQDKYYITTLDGSIWQGGHNIRVLIYHIFDRGLFKPLKSGPHADAVCNVTHKPSFVVTVAAR